jgi:hypothetical protein
MLDLLLNGTLLGSVDGMSGLINTGQSILKWGQRLGIIGASIAFLIGGYFLMLGGDRGRSRSVGWFVGGAVGLIVVMGAYGLASGIDSNIKFGG